MKLVLNVAALAIAAVSARFPMRRLVAGHALGARVYAGTGGSLLAVALWHAAHNMTSATAGSRGVIGAVTTTCVMVWAVWLLLRVWRNPGVRSCLDATASADRF